MILLANTLPMVMFLAGCGLLCMILLRRWWRFAGRGVRQRRNESPIEHHPKPNDLWGDTPKGASAHIEHQKIELYDMARDTAGQLDTKMRALQQLIAQSNQQIERLEELLADVERQRS